MSKVRKELYKLARSWDEEARVDSEDHDSFRRILKEAFFHDELRFIDYTQGEVEGRFPVRLKEWIDNVSDVEEKKALFHLLDRILFIDRLQMQSLYRDAYRRIVVPWISQGNLSAEDMLSADYGFKVSSLLRQYQFFSITNSFSFSEFTHINSCSGLLDTRTLNESTEEVEVMLKKMVKRAGSSGRGLIGLEDFAGTGGQALRILSLVRDTVPSQWRILFVPLIVLKHGLATLNTELGSTRFEIKPALVVPASACLQEESVHGEPLEFAQIRNLVNSTDKRVTMRFSGEHDDPPDGPYGRGGSGAMVVTCHNTPNNTLPLIHHRAPDWSPLFRRVHHLHHGKAGPK